MPSYKFATGMWGDTVLPRDVQMINPHFIINTAVGDMNALALEMCNAIKLYATGGTVQQIQCKIYEDGHASPSYPVGEAMIQPNLVAASVWPREIAMCLSYYADRNVRRHRGRLYVPGNWIQSGGSIGPRPTATHRTKVGDLATLLTDIGGPEVVWCVYSKADLQARPVTTWWVDDEWDIQRRRGMRGQTRTTGTTAG